MWSFVKKYGRSVCFLLFTIFLFTHNFHGAKAPGDITYFDKIVHCSLFFVLTFLVLLDTRRKEEWRYRVIISIFAYGILVEIFQGVFLPYRSASVWDILADTTGLIIGTLAFNLYKNSRFFKPAVK